MPDTLPDIRAIAESLTDHEYKWLTTDQWGSWIPAVAADLHFKGLLNQSQDGSFSLTALGQQVSQYLDRELSDVG